MPEPSKEVLAATVVKYVQEHAERGNPASVLKTMDDFARLHGWLMYVGDVKGPIVEGVIDEHKPTVLAELGVFHGYSSIRFASCARKHHASARYFSFEIDPLYAETARKNIEFAGLADTVTVFTGVWKEEKHRLRDEHNIEKVDLFFIDHSKPHYLPDGQDIAASGYLKTGSVLVADNVIYPGAPRFLEWIRHHPKFTSRTVDSELEYSNGATKDAVEISVYKE